MTQKISAKDILGHFMDESEKDPLYLTKIIISSFGKNIVSYLIRIVAYLIILYAMVTYLYIPQNIAWLITIGCIISYYALRSIKDKVITGINNKDKNGYKGDIYKL